MVCVVTGASGGTGPAIIDELAKQTYAVVGLVRGSGVNWRHIENNKYEADVDVLNEHSLDNTLSEIIKNLNTFHVWVNVVGGFDMGTTIEDLPKKTWDFMFDLNFKSALNCCCRILPIFKEQKFGRIINFGSSAGIVGMASAGPYAVGKAAVINLTKTVAKENEGNGITANVILPGIIDTPANRESMPDADFSTWTQAEEIARTIVSLISSETNGEIVNI